MVTKRSLRIWNCVAPLQDLLVVADFSHRASLMCQQFIGRHTYGVPVCAIA